MCVCIIPKPLNPTASPGSLQELEAFGEGLRFGHSQIRHANRSLSFFSYYYYYDYTSIVIIVIRFFYQYDYYHHLLIIVVAAVR